MPAPLAGDPRRTVLGTDVLTGLELEPANGLRRLDAEARSALEAVGFDITHFRATGAAIVHATHGGPFPKMIWPTNGSKLAAATMFIWNGTNGTVRKSGTSPKTVQTKYSSSEIFLRPSGPSARMSSWAYCGKAA